ncbi:hypothetical protein SAMN05428961_11724 [Paenibacillus sp. OK060]|uniref:hypothetical protein n=1 Tax=Paenibacillus sp. OK060 TaxID=1881034 RepID=UPI000891CDD9|nr:hypothetical protein [Paenibacillus sp. OK060]SDM42279.1 hypothetical protein SAMN05428961_11724 [Paenibacillus sp. OK060]
MISFNEWLKSNRGYSFVPLFETDADSLLVETKLKIVNQTERRLLKRSTLMEDAIIDTIESNINDPRWEGIIYVMGTGDLDNFIPLYIGKADKKGVKNELSANIKNIRKNSHMFARWGDGLAYHIGDLSHVLFKFEGYKKPSKKYERWAESLFTSYDPPILKKSVNFYICPWFEGQVGMSGLSGSLPAIEKEMIAIASYHYSDSLLNKDGV